MVTYTYKYKGVRNEKYKNKKQKNEPETYALKTQVVNLIREAKEVGSEIALD